MREHIFLLIGKKKRTGRILGECVTPVYLSGESPLVWDRFVAGGFMDLLAAIKREERKLEKELGQLQLKLSGIRAAAKALGDKTVREVTQVKKRVLSAAARAKISKATKARWAKFRAKKNKKTKAA
jgi:hypothetical protein